MVLENKSLELLQTVYVFLKSYLYHIVVKTKAKVQEAITTYRMCFGYSIKKAQLYLQFWP